MPERFPAGRHPRHRRPKVAALRGDRVGRRRPRVRHRARGAGDARASSPRPWPRAGAGGSSGVRHRRLRTAFVVGEIALAQVLLISAGLMIKGALKHADRRRSGSTRERSSRSASTLGLREFPDSIDVETKSRRTILAKLREIPGVEAAGLITQLPLAAVATAPTTPSKAQPRRRRVNGRWCSTAACCPGSARRWAYGDGPGPQPRRRDRRGAPIVILVNEAMVRRHWPDRDRLGRRITIFDESWEIVGVMRDVREFGPDDPAPPTAYFPGAAAARCGRRPTCCAPAATRPSSRAWRGPRSDRPRPTSRSTTCARSREHLRLADRGCHDHGRSCSAPSARWRSCSR